MKRELGTLERSFVIADRHAPFHMVTVLHLENAPPAHLLQQALKVLQNRQPFLTACLQQERGNYYFESLVDPTLPFHILPRWNAEHWLSVVEVELAHRIDSEMGPLFRCTYLYDATKERGDIILAFSHAALDTASASQLMHQLLMTCASFMDQRTIPLYGFAPTPLAESRFPVALRGLPLTLNSVRYILQQVMDEFVYRVQTRGKRIPTVHTAARRGHALSLQLAEDALDAFSQRARKEGVTLNSALNAALLLAVNRTLYAGQQVPMRTISLANLRPYVQPPLREEEIACYTAMMRHTASVSGGIDFWLLARDLHAKIHGSLKSDDKFVAAATAEPLMKMLTRLKSLRMSATALNYNGVVPIQPNYDSIKVTGLHSFESPYELGPEFSAQAQIFNHQLFVDFIYLEADMSRDEAKAIVEEMKHILNTAM